MPCIGAMVFEKYFRVKMIAAVEVAAQGAFMDSNACCYHALCKASRRYNLA